MSSFKKKLLNHLKSDPEIAVMYDEVELLNHVNTSISLSKQILIDNSDNFMQRMKTETPLYEAFAVVLGRLTLLEDKINELYTKRAYEYTRARQAQKFQYGFLSRDIAAEVRTQKVLGIVAYAMETGNFQEVEQLFKTGFKKTYRRIMQSPDQIISIEDLETRIRKETYDKANTQEIFDALLGTFVVLLFLMHEKKVYPVESIELAKLKLGEDDNAGGFTSIKIFADAPGLLVKTDIRLNTEMFDFFHELMGAPIQSLVKEIYGKSKILSAHQIFAGMYQIPFKTFNQKFRTWHLDLLDSEPTKRTLAELLDSVARFSGDRISQQLWILAKVSVDEFEMLLTRTLIHCMQTKGQSEFLGELAAQVFTYTVISDLIQTRRYLLEEDIPLTSCSDNELLQQVAEKDKQIDSLKKQLHTQEQEKQTKQKVDKELYDESQAHIRELEKRIKGLEGELEKQEDYSLEVHALRAHVFDVSQEKGDAEGDLSEASLARYREFLANEKIVVIGGHDNWINLMQKELPNALFLNADANGRDFGRLQQEDTAVFVHTKYNNHGNYYKILRLLKEDKHRLFYIERNNVAYNLKRMYEQLQG